MFTWKITLDGSEISPVVLSSTKRIFYAFLPVMQNLMQI